MIQLIESTHVDGVLNLLHVHDSLSLVGVELESVGDASTRHYSIAATELVFHL